MVVEANALVYPWAVVVLSFDALVAKEAVEGVLRFDYFARGADVLLLKITINLQERYLLGLLHTSWILTHCHDKTY